MTLGQLRTRCKEAGLEAGGMRKMLAARLQAARTDEGAWFRGVVTATRDQGAERHHEVRYDGWPKAEWHDLASERHKWRVPTSPAIDATASSPGPQPAASDDGAASGRATNGSAAPPAERRRTRVSRRAEVAASAIEAAVEALLEEPEAEVAAAFYAAAHQVLGPAGLELDVTALDDLAAACAEIEDTARAAHRHDEAECSAASAKPKKKVVVHTDGGDVVFEVPSDRTLAQSPQRDEWLAADQRGLAVILAVPGNRLVPVTVPQARNLPIAPTVTTRVIKTDKSSGRLDKFSSRHAYDGNRCAAMDEAAGIEQPELTTSSVADDLVISIVMATTASRDSEMTKLDIGGEYSKVSRRGKDGAPALVRHMHTPNSLPINDEDGTKMCIELGGSWIWGEAPSGRALQDDVGETLVGDGWRPAENVPCVYRKELPTGVTAVLLTIVDDFLVAETKGSHKLADELLELLEKHYGNPDGTRGDIKYERDPTYFAGRALARDHKRRALTVSMPRQVLSAAAEHLPAGAEHMTAKQLGLPKGKALRDMADGLKMPPASERGGRVPNYHTVVRGITGSLKFVEKVMPAISLITHRLSCVGAYPPPEAEIVAKAALHYALVHRDDGITYGGEGLVEEPRMVGHLETRFKLEDGAAVVMEATADATWSPPLLYSILLTMNGASVLHVVKKIQMLIDSSTETEAIATAKTGELVAFAREVLRALGCPPEGATFVGTDNKANAYVASGTGTSTRLKHCMRRYYTFLQRKARGEVEIGHVPDPQNPSDFLTKWVGKDKYRRSLAFATNAANRVDKNG